MTTFTSLPKLLFDPDVYMSILDEILIKNQKKDSAKFLDILKKLIIKFIWSHFWRK